MSYGMLSGKYDSTKQRAILMNGDRLRNYRRYNATLRMEILLTGGVVLTDSQFLDGLFFMWITQHGDEYEYFKECFEIDDRKTEKKYLDVKCRIDKNYEKLIKFPEKDDVAKNIFGKEFYNSSIEMKELAQYVFNLSKDYTEEVEISNKDKSSSEYGLLKKAKVRDFAKSFEEYKNDTLMNIKNLHGEYIADIWKEYADNLEKLFDFKFGRWGFYTYANGPRWINEYAVKEILNQEIYDSKNSYGKKTTYRERMYSLLMDIQKITSNASAIKYFKRIESQLDCDMRTRSIITNSFDKIEYIIHNESEIDQDDKKKAIKKINEFKCIMNDRYNKAFAYQHGCKFVDMCDYPEQLKVLSDSNFFSEKQYTLDGETVGKLGTMSWNDFKTILNKVQPYMKEWLEAYDKHIKDNDNESLIRTIEKYIQKLNEVLMEIEVDYSASSGPWNYKNTQEHGEIFDKILKGRRGYSFVGGGSFNEIKEGNEICILCPGSATDKALILRIRTMKADKNDMNYDTMIAPVENVFNGGAIYE